MFILREKESKGAEKERGRERIPSRLCAVNAELDVGLDLTNLEIMTWAKISWTFNSLSHLGALKEKFKDKINGKISCVYELEELILLKCPYYPTWCTNSMQSLSKFQWNFFKKKKIPIYMKFQRTSNSQNNLKKEKQS